MFEYNDERKTARAGHDSPVAPIPPWEKRGISESAYDAIRADRRDEKHAELRAEAQALLSAVTERVTEYRAAIRASSDNALRRYLAGRSVQLQQHAISLSAELALTDDPAHVISPWKTVIFLSGLIRELLQRPIQAEYRPKPIRPLPAAYVRNAQARLQRPEDSYRAKRAAEAQKVAVISTAEFDKLAEAGKLPEKPYISEARAQLVDEATRQTRTDNLSERLTWDDVLAELYPDVAE